MVSLFATTSAGVEYNGQIIRAGEGGGAKQDWGLNLVRMLRRRNMVRNPDGTRVREWNLHVASRLPSGLDGFYQSGPLLLDCSEVTFNSGGRFGPERNLSPGGTVTVTYRRGASITSSLLVAGNDVRLDQGSFVRSIGGARLDYSFTPRVFIQSLAQFNPQAQAWTANVRFG